MRTTLFLILCAVCVFLSAAGKPPTPLQKAQQEIADLQKNISTLRDSIAHFQKTQDEIKKSIDDYHEDQKDRYDKAMDIVNIVLIGCTVFFGIFGVLITSMTVFYNRNIRSEMDSLRNETKTEIGNWKQDKTQDIERVLELARETISAKTEILIMQAENKLKDKTSACIKDIENSVFEKLKSELRRYIDDITKHGGTNA